MSECTEYNSKSADKFFDYSGKSRTPYGIGEKSSSPISLSGLSAMARCWLRDPASAILVLIREAFALLAISFRKEPGHATHARGTWGQYWDLIVLLQKAPQFLLRE